MKKFSILFFFPVLLTLNACTSGGNNNNNHTEDLTEDLSGEAPCNRSNCDSINILIDSIENVEGSVSAACGWNFGFKSTSTPKKIKIYTFIPAKSNEADWTFKKIELEHSTKPGKDPKTKILHGKVKIEKDPTVVNQGAILGATTFDLGTYPSGVDSIYLEVLEPGGITSTLHKRKKKGLMGYDGDTIVQ